MYNRTISVFLLLLYSSLSLATDHITIEMHDCDAVAIQDHDKIMKSFVDSFEERDHDGFMCKIDDGMYCTIHFKNGYAVMVLLEKDLKVKIEVISIHDFFPDGLIERLEQSLKPSFLRCRIHWD